MTSNLYYQRDSFISEIYKAAKNNKEIYFLSADFGAPALDQFRENLKKQFLHLGICEQNMVDFACGLALENKKVYIYAMAPFLALRCLEQHKTATCLMNLNVCSIVTGIGLSYANSGPTHYSTEDFASLRSLPNCNIYTCSDAEAAKMVAKETLRIKTPVFVRLDRKPSKNFTKKIKIKDIKRGFRFLRKSNNSKNLILSHGSIIERSLSAIEDIKLKSSNNFDIIDLIRAKPFPKELKNKLLKYNSILTIDEQTSVGSLESLIKENISSTQKILPMSLPDQFIFENIGRNKLLDKYGLSVGNIKRNILKIIKS